jgi:hypothetical protein
MAPNFALKLHMKYASLAQKIRPAKDLRSAFVHFVVVADSPHKLLQNCYKTASEQPSELVSGLPQNRPLARPSSLRNSPYPGLKLGLTIVQKSASE